MAAVLGGYLDAWHLISGTKDVGVYPVQSLLAPFVVYIKALQILTSTKSPASNNDRVML